MAIEVAKNDDLAAILSFDTHIPQERLLRCIQDGQVCVLRIHNEIMGVMRWSLFWQSIPFLDLILLDEEIRGRGYGRKMMLYWEEMMKNQGYHFVLLSTQADEDAQFFYEKLGYQKTGSFLPPMQQAQELIYSKKISLSSSH